MRPIKPMRVVVRVTRSPLNGRRWALDLGCGHEVWVTSRGKPARKFAPCVACAGLQAGPRSADTPE